MTVEMEDAFPSFSADRGWSKAPVRESPVAQRRLDYNAPLLSVRRLADAGREARSKVWKLSAELSKEPLRVPGAVPFTWEHSPGRPKQSEAAPAPGEASESPPQSPKLPPRSPSSPSAPSTPSPPSTRRASPASPPPRSAPMLHRPVIRSDSSAIYSAPPPPPPPPPPPSVNKPFKVTVRSPTRNDPLLARSSSHPTLPSPLPIHGSATTDFARGNAFRLVDPTEDLLRALRARREKVDASETRSEAPNLCSETVGIDEVFNQPINERSTSRCEVVDAIVEKFLADHPDASADQEACKDSERQRDGDETGAGNIEDYDDVDAAGSAQSAVPKRHKRSETRLSDDIGGQEAFEASQFSCEEAVHGEPSAQSQEAQSPRDARSEVSEQEKPRELVALNSEPETGKVGLEMDHTQNGLLQKQQSKKRSVSIVILDSCRADSMRILKQAFLEIWRKAAAASIRSLAMARRSVTPLRRSFSSLKVVPHRPSLVPNGMSSGRHEAAVEREVEVIPQTRIPQVEAQEELQQLPVHPTNMAAGLQEETVQHSDIIPPASPILESGEILDTAQDMSPEILLNTDSNRELQAVVETNLASVTSPEVIAPDNGDLTKPSCDDSQVNQQAEIDEPVSYSGVSPMSPEVPVLTTDKLTGQQSVDCQVYLPAETDEPIPYTGASTSSSVVPISVYDTLTRQQSVDSRLHLQAEIEEPISRAGHHMYAKSLGADELNEFYDASSRFGSQNSTPTRSQLGRSMSRDWIHSEDFLDAFSTPWESPSTSFGDRRYFSSPLVAPTSSSSSKLSSKLSKRVGKSLWLDTKEISSTSGKPTAMPCTSKGFYAGELFTMDNVSQNMEGEPLSARRIKIPEDQASTSSSLPRRQNKRQFSKVQSAKSVSYSVAAVTPVFPSKCQKNRTIASASGLPGPILTEEMKDVGWPLGLSGFPPLKTKGKGKAESKNPEKGLNGNMVVLPPPLPPTPAGGSWLKRALTSNSLNHLPNHTARRQTTAAGGPTRKPSNPTNDASNKWEEIVKSSHVKPGHLRFSEELHHPPPNSSAKYYIS